MCGVGAIVRFTGSYDKSDSEMLSRILASHRYRGPDATMTTSPSPTVGLGHNRLSIIDLDPRANQPMADLSGRVHVSFNGEIFNFQELRSELEKRGHVFRTTGDTEVLLYMYLVPVQGL